MHGLESSRYCGCWDKAFNIRTTLLRFCITTKKQDNTPLIWNEALPAATNLELLTCKDHQRYIPYALPAGLGTTRVEGTCPLLPVCFHGHAALIVTSETFFIEPTDSATHKTNKGRCFKDYGRRFVANIIDPTQSAPP
jgi:hypothetical protein